MCGWLTDGGYDVDEGQDVIDSPGGCWAHFSRLAMTGYRAVTLGVTHVTVATENGEKITLAPEQLEPLVHQLDCISYDLTFPAG